MKPLPLKISGHFFDSGAYRLMKTVKIGFLDQHHPVVGTYVSKKFKVWQNPLCVPSQFQNGFVRRFADQCSEFQIFAAFFDSISDPMSLVAFDNQVFNEATDHRSTGVIAAPFVALFGLL